MPRYIKQNTIEELKLFLEGFVSKNEEIVGDIRDALISLEECIGASKLMKDLSKFDFYHD